jgi:hypothetical protein
MKLHMVVLRGQGDEIVSLVNEGHYAWITDNKTPGRKGREGAWVDTGIPADVRAKLDAMAATVGELVDIEVTSGSYQNDRALISSDGAEWNNAYKDAGISAAKQWARDNGHTIADEEYHGYLY